MIRIGRFPIRTLLGARPGLGTQARYEVPGDLRVEYVTHRWLTLGEWGCLLLSNGPKLAVESQTAVKKSYLWIEFNCSKAAELLRGDSVPLNTTFLEIRGTFVGSMAHLTRIDERWVNHKATIFGESSL